MVENLRHFEPDERQYQKFEEINSLPDDVWERSCVAIDDCSICDMAIHQELFTTSKHTCVYGMSEERFRSYMDNADVCF